MTGYIIIFKIQNFMKKRMKSLKLPDLTILKTPSQIYIDTDYANLNYLKEYLYKRNINEVFDIGYII